MGSNIAFAAASAALAIQVVPASQSAPLRPSGPWNVEYADKMCILARDFGEGEARVTLGFKPGPASDEMRIILLRRDVSTKVDRGEAQLFMDGLPAIKGRFAEGPVKDKSMRIMGIDVMRSELQPLKAAKRLQIQAGAVNIQLAPTIVADAMKVLTHCENDLLIEWGMDPAILANIAQFPRIADGDCGACHFTSDDYPSEAIRREEQGTVGGRIHVGADGKVTKCDVYESSGSTYLDNRTCHVILTRYRYEPARGRDGQPVPSFSFQRIRWELPSY